MSFIFAHAKTMVEKDTGKKHSQIATAVVVPGPPASLIAAYNRMQAAEARVREAVARVMEAEKQVREAEQRLSEALRLNDMY